MSQVYFITGANRGLGFKFCETLLASGNTVHATVRALSKATDLVRLKEKNPDRLFIYEIDCADYDAIQNLPLKLKNVPVIDTFINNAGYFPESDRTGFMEQKPSDLEYTFKVNTIAPMELSKALLLFLQKSKAPKAVYITSLMGSIADNSSGGYYAYRMSKTALNMFLKSFSIDFPTIISAVLHPGWVQTDMGGKNATITPEQSINGMLSVIQNLKKTDSGAFFNYDGAKLPW